MTNSISPLLTPIDVMAHQHSILTLGFDEISDLVFHFGRVWFMWHNKPRAAEREKLPNSLGKIGIASCEIDESGKLCNLHKWVLPLPPNYVPANATARPFDFKISTMVGSHLVALVTINYDRPTFGSSSDTIVLRFSADGERWYLGVYGSATKKFRFHVIETPADITADKISAATVSGSIILYTHDGEIYGGIDDTQYGSDEWKRSPEVTRLLDLSFFQKIEALLPFAAPFIFLNSNVPWDEQITDPAGGKAVFIPSFDNRVILLHNYELMVMEAEQALSQAPETRYKFKWPGLAIERDDHWDIVFAVGHDQAVDWKYALLCFRIPTPVIEQSAMIHTCQKDIFSCVAGFCAFLQVG